MANMNIPASWTDPTNVADHLGAELCRGRLAVFLGAGLSAGYGLPNWKALVDRLHDLVGDPHPADSDDLITAVGALRVRHFKGQNSEFLGKVKEALYQGKSLTFDELRQHSLMAAIGALVMASQRGQASAVVTLNYDDFLERYLEFHGLLVQAVADEVHWASNDDVRIYHPHGLLSADGARKDSEDLIFGTQEYQKIISGGSNWRPLLETILRTHTTLYIGLSGTDMHLQSLLGGLKAKHAISRDRYAYHGVRFGVKPASATDTVLDDLGVFNCLFDRYEELAPFLFSICQSARKYRLRLAGS